MPAGRTYTPIARQTLSTTASDVTFSNIPQGYTDLVIVVANLTNSTTQTLYARVNGDTGTNYSATILNGTGSTVNSYRLTTSANGLLMGGYGNGMSNTTPGTVIATILNYSNTTTNKTSLTRYNLSSAEVESGVGLWRSTAAITSLTFRPTGGTFNSGITFTLYGIAAA